MQNYYEAQLNRIKTDSEYGVTVKFTCESTETKHFNLSNSEFKKVKNLIIKLKGL